VTAKKLAPGVGGTVVRSASAAISGTALTGTAANGTVATATIQAPSTGVLQITASSDVFSSGNDAGIGCVIDVDGADVRASERVLLNTGSPTTDDHIDNCATNVTVPAAAGQHTVTLNFTGVDDASVDERTLDVLFVADSG
jgi:hypothetical protein